jgi:hypothetical protein
MKNRGEANDYLFLHPTSFLIYGSKERETGLEPATNSLEGCDSTN